MSYDAPKGHSLHDSEAAYKIKLPGTFIFAALPANRSLGTGLLAYCTDLNGGAGGYAYYNQTTGTWTPLLSSTTGGITSTGGTITPTVANGVTNLDVTPGVFAKLLFNWGIPVFAPSSCTMGTNGAFTAMTAVPSSVVGNCFLILPAGYVTAAQLAGVFAATLSSTTAGTIYNNTLTSGVPVFPASPTAFSASAGTGTQSTGAQVALTLSVPANTLGPNGAIEFRLQSFLNNNANGKTISATFGGTSIESVSAASAATVQAIRTVRNLGVTNRQLSFNSAGSTDFGSSGNGATNLTLDTTTTLSFIASVLIGTATDYGGFYGGTVFAYYAA